MCKEALGWIQHSGLRHRARFLPRSAGWQPGSPASDVAVASLLPWGPTPNILITSSFQTFTGQLVLLSASFSAGQTISTPLASTHRTCDPEPSPFSLSS